MADSAETMEELPHEVRDKMVAGVKMVGRTGATDFQIRYCDEEQPVVWLAVATYRVKAVGNYTSKRHEVAAGMEPVQAVLRLLDQLIDGGSCTHCGRPTGVTDDVDAMPLAERFCWYQYDPELKTFRRGCEGDT